MRAVLFDVAGDPREVLRLGEAPEPVLSPGGVLIEVKARVVQPADLLFVRGRYRVKPALPQVAGFDGAGVVVATGPSVRGLAPGQRVAFRAPGAWAERAVAPATRVYPVPDDVADEVACQFPLNPLTAWGLLDSAGLASGARVLTTAGRSVVAELLAAIARRKGIALVRVARAGGAHAVVGPDAGAGEPRALDALLRRAVEEAGPFDAVLDAVGGPDTLTLAGAVAPGGQLVSYGVLDDRPFPIQVSTLLFRDLTWRGFGVELYLRRLPHARLAEAAALLWDVLRTEPACAPVAARVPLADFREALAASAPGGGPWKAILVTGA